MIPTFESADFLEAALRSVLDQDPGPAEMEIVVVDDHSMVDDVAAVVQQVAGDRVQFVRQPRNVGHVRNFNECLRLSRGELVHLLHGDDLVLDGFYRVMERPFIEHPMLGGAICRYTAVDEAGARQGHLGPLLRPEPGVLEDWAATIASGQAVQPPAVVHRRAVFEVLGGFEETIRGYAEDWELLVRVAAAYPVWFEPSVLAAYRVRAGSLSDVSRLRSNMRDMRRVFALNQLTLAKGMPVQDVRRITRSAQQSLADALVRRARRRINGGDRALPWRSAAEAIRISPRPRTLLQVLRLLLRWVRPR